MSENEKKFHFDHLQFLNESTDKVKRLATIEYVLRILEADQSESTNIYIQKIQDNLSIAHLFPKNYLSTVLSWLALLSEQDKSAAENELKNMQQDMLANSDQRSGHNLNE